jgi:hypothetical protein
MRVVLPVPGTEKLPPLLTLLLICTLGCSLLLALTS